RFVIGMYDSDTAIRNTASEVAQIAYLIALWTWTWTMTHREPASSPAPEALERMRSIATEYDAVPRERILAAVGIRLAEPVEVEAQEQGSNAEEIAQPE